MRADHARPSRPREGPPKPPSGEHRPAHAADRTLDRLGEAHRRLASRFKGGGTHVPRTSGSARVVARGGTGHSAPVAAPPKMFDYLQHPVLVVDDEQDNLDAFRFAFRRSFRVHYALGAAAALEELERVRPAVVVSDQRMPGTSGIELLTEIRARRPETVGILLTAYTELSVLLEAIHSGAVHRYVSKPWDSKELAVTLRQAIERYAVLDENRRLREQLARYAGYLEREQRDPFGFGAIVGESEAMGHVNAAIARVAPTTTPVLLRGEAGVGKRTVALAIHTQSEREHGPFVELAVAGHTPDAQLRELTGWQSGAAPGALAERAGRLELGNHGTLFLDGIDALSLASQSVLVRALESGSCERLGGGPSVSTDVRLVASTTRDLGELEATERLLPELRGRLEVFPIDVPPLRERRADLPRLAEHVLARLARRNARVPRALTPAALTKLDGYDWPGNVREFENVLERAAILCRGSEIDAPHLVFAESAPRREPASTPPLAVGPAAPLPERLDELERRELIAALEACGGNKAEVARVLGVQRTTLYYRLKRLGIDA